MPRRRTRRVLPRRGSGSPLTEARLPAQEVETYELVRLLHPRAAVVGLESCELLRVRVERIHLHASFDGSRRSNASSMFSSPRAAWSSSSTLDGGGVAGLRSMPSFATRGAKRARAVG